MSRCGVLFFCGVLLVLPATAPARANNAEFFFPGSEHPQVLRERLANRILGDKRIDDPAFFDYYRAVGKLLAAAGDDYLIVGANSDAVNAFAHFGAIIVVMDGMWRFVRNEDEFLSVMAHEMGHIKQDHFRRQRELSEKLAAISVPLLIGGLLADDPEVKKAVIVGGSGILTSQVYAFSRELEHEADVYAVKLMGEAVRNSRAAAQVMARLQGAADEYISTHPASARRAAYLGERLRGLPQPPLQSGMGFLLLREKVGIKYGNKKTARQRRLAIVASDADAREKIAARYGLLLLANESRDTTLGAQMAAELSTIDHPLVAVAAADSLRRQGDVAGALALLKKTHAARPRSANAALALMKHLNFNNQSGRAAAVFDELPDFLRRHPALLKAAARANAVARRRALASLQLSRAAFYEGDFAQATRQIAVGKRIKAAINIAQSFVELEKKIKRETITLEKLRRQQ